MPVLRKQHSSKSNLLPVYLWQANILAFLLLFAIGAGVFGIQMHGLSRAFFNDARDHARLAAGIIFLNARHAITSRKVLEEILEKQLNNTAEFVNYLDQVEPFSMSELSAFAREAGLAGVGIIRGNSTVAEGPGNWLQDMALKVCSQPAGLIHISSRHLFVQAMHDRKTGNCIYLGIRSDDIEKLQQRIGLENTLREIRGLNGIAFADFKQEKGGDGSVAALRQEEGNAAAVLTRWHGIPVVEITMPAGTGRLLLGMDAAPLFTTKARIVRYFLMFSAVLLTVGAILTYVLYRFQKAYLIKVRAYERRLADQREEAAMGRAAAGIAHEIRNPLNSVAMGLQRMQFDSEGGSVPQKKLLKVMLQEIRRTDRIIAGLLTYSRPVNVNWQPVILADIFREQVELAGQGIDARGITVSSTLQECTLYGDPDLLRQMVSNLTKNAIEALPDGGEIQASIRCTDRHVRLVISNRCDPHHITNTDRFFEPYFTTRTRGTGLGLAICRRIAEAHGGTINIDMHNIDMQRDIFAVTVTLPVKGPSGNNEVESN